MLRMKVSPSHLAQRALLLVLAGSLMAACGPLGDDEQSDPTSTSVSVQQPTNEPDAETPPNVNAMPTEPDGTPPITNTDLSTPISQATEEAQTPESISISTPLPDADSTPMLPEATPTEGDESATPEAMEGGDADSTDDTPANQDAQFSDSDGTSGAMPGAPQPANATPVAGDDEDEATPEVSASPVADDVTLAELEPATVSNCDVADVAPIPLAQVDYVLNSDANFRVGPGADCDAITDTPIGEFTAVTLIGGPVVREDDDEFVWVQVEIAGETGWIITDVLDPVS